VRAASARPNPRTEATNANASTARSFVGWVRLVGEMIKQRGDNLRVADRTHLSR